MGKKSKHSKKQWRGKEARQLAEEATQAAVRGAEQERLEQTVASAPDAVLFFQDKGPAEVKIKVEEDPSAELRKLKLERARKRLPKGTSMFHQRPQGPADLLCPPLIPNQAPTTKKKDITKILEKLETSILKEKESGKAKTKSKKRSRNDFDVWETEKDVVKMPDNVKREYVEQTLIAPATKPKKRKLSAVSKISTINSTNSILHPLAGQSYRPDPMQHEETLAVAVAMEQRKRDEEDRIKRMMSYPSNLKGVIGSDILDGYNADQRDTSSDESDSDQSDNETKLETSARKTKKMRNKEKKKAQNELQRKLKEWKKRETQEYSKADQYVRDIESKKVALEVRRKDRAAHRIKQRLLGIQPKRIGKVKYQKPGLDIALRDEIPNALRGVSAASSIGLLKTHYASLQERNVLVTPDLTKRVCKRRNVRVHIK